MKYYIKSLKQFIKKKLNFILNYSVINNENQIIYKRKYII